LGRWTITTRYSGSSPTLRLPRLKKAFKELALKYHPDQHPSSIANVVFRRIHEAYEVLSDPERRKRYDEERRASGSPRRERKPEREKQPSRPVTPAGRREQARREAGYRTRFVRQTARKAREVSRAACEENEAELRRILDDYEE
jgi:curved DNA-binding protein CbpA